MAEEERRKRRKRFSPLGPLLLTLVLALIEWVVRRDTPRSFDFSSRAAPMFLILVFGLLYCSRIVLGRYVLFRPSPFSAAKPPMICAQCQTTQVDTESHHCSCGGLLEPLDHWRWSEDPTSGELSRHT
jgi:hypothetical protein